jgi:glycolate oxidase iron-sulfur subunit
MNKHQALLKVEEEMHKCMKCGNCQAVCPIYKETKKESSVARGKIQLAYAVLKGELDYNEAIEERFALCLTCKACNANCPCGVEVDKIVLAARAAIANNKGLPTIKKSIFSVLKHPGLFDFSLKMGSKFQGLVFKKKKEGRYNPRFPIGLDTSRVMPPLAKETFRDSVEELTKAEKPQKRVAFFTGCVVNYMYTNFGHATMNVLKENNVEVIVPKEQHCCGAPVLIHGDIATATEMAKSHLDIFSKLDVDHIIMVCGTCGEAFRHNYLDLVENDPEYLAKAQAIAEKSLDISEFLTKVIQIDPAKLGEVPMKITYHDPCHLVRGLGVSKQPRELLKAIPGVEFTEMKNPARCCGGSGSFCLTHYDLSLDIFKQKAQDIQGTNTDFVVTGCGSCTMQIENGLEQHNLPHQVFHTIELLDKAYKAKK